MKTSTRTSRPVYILLFLLAFAGFAGVSAFVGKGGQHSLYQCTPCGEACDNEAYAEEGYCRVCKMELVKQSSVQFKEMKPEEVCAFIKAHPKVLLLDVRSADEFEGKTQPDYGTLKNAMNIPVTELANKTDKLKKWKGKDIIVYCSMGKRSATASYRLGLLGFEKVHNMTGGLSQMKDESCKKKR